MSILTSANSSSISLDELITRQEQAKQTRGFEPMALEVGLLLQRVKDGGYSGDFLAHAFISSYRTDQPFKYPLGKIMKLDWEGVRLFHQILHIRYISGWSDQALYDIEQQIKAIQTKECK